MRPGLCHQAERHPGGAVWMPQEVGAQGLLSCSNLVGSPTGARGRAAPGGLPPITQGRAREGGGDLRAKEPKTVPPFLKHYGADPGILDSD